MNKYLGGLAFSLVCSLLLFSCKGSKSAVQPAAALPHSLLWKIEKAGLSQPSYLFGTIHMIPKEDYFLPSGLDEAFDQSKNVVFEIDLDEMSGIGSMMGMLSNLMMNDGTTLEDLLTDQEYAEVSTYFEKMGLPMFLLSKVKPMFLSMLAEINMDPSEMQSDDVISYEMELYERAQKTSKEVGGLETMEYQMSLFDSIPYKDQAVMLLDAVRSTNAENDMFDQTVELYKHQDIEAMIDMVSDAQPGEDSDFENMLINNRNQNWIPVMAKMMNNGPVFFAVGAGHLAGENGVLNLLKKQGYKLTPVSVYKAVTPKRV
ncbi:MAG TPA: TraB/GumN family protein [Saprospiraceae bacterium]|nr:TraB/GumN family protein [Saprospiraceae bacterium]